MDFYLYIKKVRDKHEQNPPPELRGDRQRTSAG